MGSKMGQDGGPGAQANLAGSCLGSSWFQDAPRWPKIPLRWPKKAPKCPKMASRRPQDGSRRPQDGPRWPQVAQDSPKLAQKGSQDRPKMVQMGQDGSKIGPTRLQNRFPTAFFALTFSYFFSFPFLSFPNGGASLSYIDLPNLPDKSRQRI